ncbi:MAG: hypothetical protein ACLGIO_07530, partial [Acidimicrobiia bacterium]
MDFPSVPLWPLALAASLVAFLLPGLLGAAVLGRRDVVPTAAVPLTAVVLSSTIGYAAFWAYLADDGLGRAFSVAANTAGVAVPVVSARARRLLWRTARSSSVAVPLALLLLVAAMYNGVLFAHGAPTPVVDRANVHLLDGNGLPPDNHLPRQFADRLFLGEDPRRPFGDWRSSDRPPLQTGAVLLQRPFSSALGIEGLHYQLLSSALQCTWLAAAWALCAAARFRPRATALALVVAAFSGFFFLNSVFVWPKLYAAALVLSAYVLLVGRRPPWPAAAVGALAAALGSLAHAGVVFTLVPLAAVVLARRSRPSPSGVLAGAAVVAVLLGPWWAYGRFYDPPGNRLAKWHLAGSPAIDARSLTEALADSYSRAGGSVIVRNKADNLAAVVRPLPRWSDVRDGGAEQFRQWEFRSMAWALGPLNLGWVALAAGLAGQARKRWSPPAGWRPAAAMVGLGLAAVVVWALMMFGPGTTVIHQGSYATMVLLWVGLAGVVGARSPRWGAAVALVQVAWFVVVWARDLPGPAGPLAA